MQVLATLHDWIIDRYARCAHCGQHIRLDEDYTLDHDGGRVCYTCLELRGAV